MNAFILLGGAVINFVLMIAVIRIDRQIGTANLTAGLVLLWCGLAANSHNRKVSP